MSNLYDKDVDLLEMDEEIEESELDELASNTAHHSNARRRLEMMMEDKLLRSELDDFMDY